MAERKWVRLKDTAGSFYDAETGFKIVRDEVKPLGRRIGERTRKKLEGLGLVSASPPGEESAAKQEAASGAEADRVERLCDEHTKADLQEMAEGMGIEVPPKANKREIAAMIANAG
jgi:hypothetical protein